MENKQPTQAPPPAQQAQQPQQTQPGQQQPVLQPPQRVKFEVDAEEEGHMKKQVNYWKIMTFVFLGMFIAMAIVNVINFNATKIEFTPVNFPSPAQDRPTPTVMPTRAPAGTSGEFQGTVLSGGQVERSYCSEGLYLIASGGGNGPPQPVLLKLDAGTMITDTSYVGKKVEVSGIYPAQEVFCTALTCECEDYMLVEQIDITQ